MRNFQFLFFVAVIFLASCTDDEDCCVLPPEPYGSGVFVANQGNFGSGTGTVSFIGNDGEVQQNIFQTVNSRPLGNVVQSLGFDSGRGVVIVNNAQKAEVVNAGTFESIGVVNGLDQPRYFMGFDESKGYISQWGADGVTSSVKVVDMNDFTISKSISTGSGSDRMLMNGSDLLVVNVGGFGLDSTIAVINTVTDEVSQTIEVAKNPAALQLDADGDVWVICNGTIGSSGKVMELDGSTYSVKRSLDLPGNAYDGNLVLNNTLGHLVYFFNDGLYKIDMNGPSLASSQISTSYYYGIGFNPSTGFIYAADAKDFTVNGAVDILDFEGNVQSTIGVGVIPGNFAFKQ